MAGGVEQGFPPYKLQTVESLSGIYRKDPQNLGLVMDRDISPAEVYKNYCQGCPFNENNIPPGDRKVLGRCYAVGGINWTEFEFPPTENGGPRNWSGLEQARCGLGDKKDKIERLIAQIKIDNSK